MSAAMGALSAIFWGVILLSSLVFVHEAGHYLAARAFGMRVTEFFLGMPCRWRISHKSADHGTEVGVTPILLGGYNRICGMEGQASQLAARILECVARHGRVAIADIASELGFTEEQVCEQLSILVDWASVEPYYDEAAGERPSQKEWPRCVQTVERDANLLTAFDSGHDFSLEGSTLAGEPHALPEGGAGELLALERAHTYQGKGFIARVITLLAGPVVNVVLGIALIAGVLSVCGIDVASNSTVIGAVAEGSLAQASDLEAGDAVTSVAGQPCEDWVSMGQMVRDAISSGEPFVLEVQRAGQSFALTVDPASVDGDGKLGVTATIDRIHPSPVQSLSLAWNYLTATFGYVAQLFQPAHTAEVVSQSTSVVGISVMASEAAASGAESFLFLMAAISLSLGIMNLIPIPPLDGGKLLIELVQLVIKRDVPMRVQGYLSYLGLALALLLFFAVLRQDIVRFVIGG